MTYAVSVRPVVVRWDGYRGVLSFHCMVCGHAEEVHPPAPAPLTWECRGHSGEEILRHAVHE